jgi:hypothetical protein
MAINLSFSLCMAGPSVIQTLQRETPPGPYYTTIDLLH